MILENPHGYMLSVFTALAESGVVSNVAIDPLGILEKDSIGVLIMRKRARSVAVVGSGGREHALLWKLGMNSDITQLWSLPGNAGGGEKIRRVPMQMDAISNITSFCLVEKCNLVVIGPEAPLAMGLADCCRVEGIPAFGPSQRAARIESSKSFARNIMQKYSIPSPLFETCSDAEEAKRFVRKLASQGKHAVIKADGLAAGKGVIVCGSIEEADEAIETLMVRKEFGNAGGTVVVEERLHGPEISIFAITDGERVVMLPPSQDHKRLGEGDTGPNTGGMGAYCPVPGIDEPFLLETRDRILRPAIRGMAQEGVPYMGLLYAGLMITNEGPCVIEFNCRFGDPEMQAVLPVIEEDLYPVLLASAQGELPEDRIIHAARSAVCVVMASEGYPGDYDKGKEITGLDAVASEMADTAFVFHAGTELRDGKVVTNGGRVLGVTGLGENFETARANAYAACERIHFDGAYYRKDIGHRFSAMSQGASHS